MTFIEVIRKARSQIRQKLVGSALLRTLKKSSLLHKLKRFVKLIIKHTIVRIVGLLHGLLKRLARIVHKSYKFTHHHVAKRPHEYLKNRYKWYDWWHSWKWKKIHHGHIHWAVAGSFALFMGVLVYNSYQKVYASDLSTTWDYTTPSDYTLSSGVETSGTSARLKAQNYTSDSNTKALYHLDESSGTTATDASSNSNSATTANSPAWATGNLNNGLSLNGSTQSASAPDSASLSFTGSNTLEAWTKFNTSFSAGSHTQNQPIVDKGDYKLYYDSETGKVTYEMANSGATGWTQQAGGDMLNNNGANIKHSWDTNGKQSATAVVKMGSNIYAALGSSINDAEIWEYNTGTGIWTQIAGDGINSSWDNEVSSTIAYESVLSLATNGTDVLYAGLGTGANDGDVWRYKSGSWAQIGGDGTYSGWAGNAFNGVYSLAVSGTTVYAGLGTGGNMGQVWVCTNCETSPSWGGSRLGGYSGTARGWGNGYEVVYSMTIVGGNPVVGLGSGAGDGEVWHCTASCTTPGSASWTKRGGDGTGASGQSWGSAEYILSMASNGNTIYVGTGINTSTDANVWSCDTSGSCDNTTGWTKLGSSADFGTDKEGVYSIANNGSTLYVGTGSSSANGDDEVYRYDGSWTKIGGDNLNSGWNATHNSVRALVVDGTTVYAGLTNATEAYFWKCTSCSSTSPTWGGARIGGKFVNKSWGAYNMQSVESSATVGGKLYVGTGNTVAGNATVWEYDPATSYWTMVGGQGINSGWGIDTYESVISMVNYKNQLYVGLGTTAGDAEVWRWDGSSWTKIGGDGVGSSWNTVYETVFAKCSKR